MSTRRLFRLLLTSALVLSVTSLALSVIQAQPARPPRATPSGAQQGGMPAQGDAFAQTATAFAQTANGQQGGAQGNAFAQTATAFAQTASGQQNGGRTGRGIFGTPVPSDSDFPATLTALASTGSNVALTATQYAAQIPAQLTALAQTGSNFAATATALAPTLASLDGRYATQAALIIPYYATNSSLGFDPTAQVLSITFPISESTLNLAIQQALLMYGYSYSVNVNLIPDGMIITLDGYSFQGITGTLSLTYRLLVSDAGYSLVLVSAQFNGRTIPTDNVDAALQASLQVALDTALTQVSATAIPINASLSIQSLMITDNEVIVTALISF